MKSTEDIKKIVESMTVDELCGQVLNLNLAALEFPAEDYEKVCAEIHLGSIYTATASPLCPGVNQLEMNHSLANAAQKYTGVPALVLTDGVVENFDLELTKLGWGSADDPELMEKFGVVYGEMLRKTGNHVLLGPVVDINYNFNSPIVNTRAFSDDPDHVIKMAGAFVRGLTENSNVIACCKHFPGDGMDDRNQHYCTTINSKSREDWLDTYGRVYRKMFKNGAQAVMCAHICLPSFQGEEEKDPITGYLPCSLSKNLMTDLLKGTLGFDGCIISDAMNMIGAVAVCKREELGVRFINAGGDLMLFAEPEDFGYIKSAVENGIISVERLKDAVTRVLNLKNTVGLLDELTDDSKISFTYDAQELIKQAVAKVIKIERDFDQILPLKLKKGDRVLLLNLLSTCKDNHDESISNPLAEELERRGFIVKQICTPFVHTVLKDVCSQYECVLVNSFIDVAHSNGGTVRCGSEHMGPFWDGFGMAHPNFVYTSFGDPYKLYDHPFLHCYINAFSTGKYTQQYLVKILLGEEQARGKNPVEHKGFFQREV